jgi:hypothetical protein
MPAERTARRGKLTVTRRYEAVNGETAIVEPSGAEHGAATTEPPVASPVTEA